MFAKLETLQVWEASEKFLLDASQCDFPSLTSLVLGHSYDYADDGQIPGDQAASRFIANITGTLKSIHLSTDITEARETSKALAAILGTHGQSIKKLSLVGTGCHDRHNERRAKSMTREQIEEIGKACPNLRELRVPVRRRPGDIEEVSMSKAVGTHLPQLRKLGIRLDSVQEGEGKDEKSARDLMINVAVDEALARTIMATVLDAQRQPTSLSQLHLESGRSTGIPVKLSGILDKLEFQWKCFSVYNYNQGSGR
ncbi:uncharacterized protein BDV17DRAFT_294068 [Aspergillus undulatus]|uniref:uncharacterized protein n=1 Tax=Aspergillus undulatus TaxID=1810928 RepID=UPI003CCD4468